MIEIEKYDFCETFESKYREYAKEVIENRALIDIRDGLKTVTRRILWSMYDNRMFPDKPTVKVARIVGNTMGVLHPHGDDSIYRALVRLAQSCSLREPLFIGQGNFGDEENPPAAARYIEAKLSPAGLMVLDGIDEEVVDFADNYDSTTKEPVYLPSKFPQLLINGGGSGMAVGISFDDICHNPKEICDAIRLMINNPESTAEDIAKIVKGPDWNCGGYFIQNEEILKYISTGKGKITVIGKALISIVDGKTIINIKELPYQYGKSKFMTEIADNIKANPGGILASAISKFKDLTDQKSGTNIMIELKSGYSSEVVMQEIMQRTGFKQNVQVNMNILKNSIPLAFGLIDCIKEYIENRRGVIKRITEKKLRQVQKELSRLSALISALDKIDEIIAIIKGSNNSDIACEKIMKLLNVTEEQAKYILDIPLKRLTRLEASALKKTYEDELAKEKELKSILDNKSKIDDIILKDMDDVEKICDCKRKTNILTKIPSYIATNSKQVDEKLCMMATYDNKIKLVKKFNNDLSEKESNSISRVKQCHSSDSIVVFCSNGEYFANKIGTYEINTRNHSGNILFADANNMCDVDVLYQDEKYISTLTSDGKIKKSKLSDFPTISKKPTIYIKLSDGCRVLNNIIHSGGDYILITKDGYVNRYSSDKINAIGRTAQGVLAIAKTAGELVGMFVVKEEDETLVVFTENGYGKKVKLSDIPTSSSKGGKGILLSKITGETGPVAGGCLLGKEGKILVVTNMESTVSFDSKEIYTRNRQHKGDVLIDMIMGQKIARVERVI